MSDQNNTPAQSDTTRPKRCRGRGRFAFFAVALALVAGFTGAIATKAFSRGPHFGHHFMSGPMDTAYVGKRAERAMRHLAIEVDATKEQTDKLVAIGREAAEKLVPLRNQLVAGRGQIRAILLSPKIDREAIEKLRTEKMALVETATKVLTNSLSKASEVLTAKQRQELDARISRMQRRMRAFHHWMHRG